MGNKIGNANFTSLFIGSSKVKKIYCGNSLIYGNGQVPCFIVVSNYSDIPVDTEFNKAYVREESKWYLKNNTNAWEEYGKYEKVDDLASTTHYEGKLVVLSTDNHQYQYKNGQWIDKGLVEGSGKQSNFTLSDVNNELLGKTTPPSIGDYIILYPNTAKDSTNGMIIENNSNYLDSWTHASMGTIDDSTTLDRAVWVLEDASNVGENYCYIKNVATNRYWGYQSRASSNSLSTVESASKIAVWVDNSEMPYGNGISLREKSSGSNYGINDLFNYGYRFNWWTTLPNSDNNSDFYYKKVNAYQAVYPVEYEAMSIPPEKLTVATIAERDALECPYEGLKVQVKENEKTYVFKFVDGEYVWEERKQYYTVNLTQSGSWIESTKNPDSSKYYGYMSDGSRGKAYGYDTMVITLFGYTDFVVYICSYAEQSSDYTMIGKIDTTIPTSAIYYNNSNVYLHTSENQAPPNALSNYKAAIYSNLDPNVEHTIWVQYKKDVSVDSNDDRGYVLIPK